MEKRAYSIFFLLLIGVSLFAKESQELDHSVQAVELVEEPEDIFFSKQNEDPQEDALEENEQKELLDTKTIQMRVRSCAKGAYHGIVGAASAWVAAKMILQIAHRFQKPKAEFVKQFCTENGRKSPRYQEMINNARLEDIGSTALEICFCGIIVYAHLKRRFFQTALHSLKEAFL